MMQMLSLMQDGGDTVTKGLNQIYYPQRKKISTCAALGKMGAIGKLDEECGKKMKEND